MTTTHHNTHVLPELYMTYLETLADSTSSSGNALTVFTSSLKQ